MQNPSVLNKQFCTFYIDNLLLGVDVLEVQEILRQQEITLVPLAIPAIRGLINLRGQIVTAIDLRYCLELPARPSDSALMNVIVQIGDALVSLIVDEVGDVIEFEAQDFEPVPQHISPQLKHLLNGVYKLENELLMVLNCAKIIEK